MSNPRARAAELEPDLDIPWSNKAVLMPILHVAAPLLFHPQTHFEGGETGQALWREHLESDAGTMVIMSHAEEADAVLMASLAQANRALHPMRYNTIVTAKQNLRNLPYGAGFIVRHGGTSEVDRVYENPGETPEQKELRQKRNLRNRDIGVTVMRAGGTMLIYPEGGTGRRITLADGNFKKIPREKDEMLPLQSGFAHIINDSPPEVRDRIRIMTVVSRYTRERFRILRPTTVILDPVKPVDGSAEDIRQQGEELMARGFELAIELDQRRR